MDTEQQERIQERIKQVREAEKAALNRAAVEANKVEITDEERARSMRRMARNF